MRRKDLQLLALAKRGDRDALCEVGQRYLTGSEGFPRYIDLGLKYLSHQSLENFSPSAKIIAEALPLAELVRRNLLFSLTTAANCGSASASLKLGFWLALARNDEASTLRLLSQASQNGSAHASAAMTALAQDGKNPLRAALSYLAVLPEIDASGSLAQMLSSTIKTGDFQTVVRVLEFVTSTSVEQSPELCDAVCDALVATQGSRISMPEMNSDCLQSILEDCVRRGSSAAALILGRALCGTDAVFAWSASLALKRNVKEGRALLLRAAEAGLNEAWFPLYQVHADFQGSDENSRPSRFFLQKAAASGNPSAKRQLGVSILKSAVAIEEFESGMHWMTQAAHQGDVIARNLLRTLVLSTRGEDQEAYQAIVEITRHDAGVAHRLLIARDFGLTKEETICADFSLGIRPWGLVISNSMGDGKFRHTFNRAIPALEASFLDHLNVAAHYFQQGKSGTSKDTDHRQAWHTLEHVLNLCRCDESLFFAQVPDATLASPRQGTSWAHSVEKLWS